MTTSNQASRNRRFGRGWEDEIAEHAAQQYGLPWDRAKQHGTEDYLDVVGCLPDGWLVGGKALGARAEKVKKNGMSAMSQRMSEGQDQCDRAMVNLAARYAENPNDPRLYRGPVDDVVPVQVVQRRNYPVGQAYVVMTYDRFLRLVLERRAWDAWERNDEHV